MDVVRYLRVLRRRWRVIAILAVLGAAAGALLVPKPEPKLDGTNAAAWIAVHTLFDSSVNTNNSNSLGSVNAEQASFMVTSGDVPERVSQELGGNASDLASRVVARANEKLGTVEITAKATSPGEARKLSDAFAQSLLQSVADIQQREITRQREQLTVAIEQLRTDLANVQGEDRPQQAARERYLEDISQREIEMRALDQAAAAGSPMYSFGSSEAFQVTPSQLDTIFQNPTQQTRAQRQNQGSARDFRSAGSDSSTIELNPLLGSIIGLALGALAGVMLVLVINTLDPRIFTKEDAEEALGFPVIAEIPAFNRKLRKETIVISREAPYSRFAEAYRVLRSSVLFAKSEQEGAVPNGQGNGNGQTTPGTGATTVDTETPRQAVVLMVTSPGPSEGKTTTVSNLATVLAEDGSSILVVNCDFRRPRLHSYLGGGGEPRKVFDTAVPGVKLVTGVVDEPERVAPAEVIGAQRRLIETAKSHYDYILHDTAPILTTNDASELLPVVDMVVMICRAGKTTKESADRAAELLERFRAPVVGGVLVAAANAPTRQYYYFYAARPKPMPEAEPTYPRADLRAGRKGKREAGVAASSRAGATADETGGGDAVNRPSSDPAGSPDDTPEG